MKTSKKIISMLLCIVMVLSTFAGLGLVFDDFKASAANITLGGITQQRVVGTDGSYASTYAGYQDRFFKGKETNWPTNFVIPGLGSSDDYTPQGLTYWEAKDWILISAYHAGGSKPSVIYALDASTTNFVALFNIYNADGSANMSHGGGIAASEYNFYFADSGSKISYVPLSEMDVADNTVKNITLRGSINCAGELMGEDQSASVATSYCCYEEGVLWTGNFYWTSDAYDTPWHSKYPSILMGYRLKGNSSAEEWANLQNTNVATFAKQTSGTCDNANGPSFTITTREIDDEGVMHLKGSVTAGSIVDEAYTHFDNGSINSGAFKVWLEAGKSYVFEFDTVTQVIDGSPQTDMFFFANGEWSYLFNIKPSSTITDNGDGSYHYRAVYTPTTTATYVGRLDQDNVSTSYDFEVKNFRIYSPNDIKDISNLDGKDRCGNPTYVVPFSNEIDTLDRIQYAMVYKGKIYISRSWSRTESANHIRELCVGDFDINAPGDASLKVNGRTRTANVVKSTYDDTSDVIKFGGDTSNSNRSKMFYMSEGICVINDYIYMFGEGAAWAYNGKPDKDGNVSKCTEPIDVLWKIDQYAIMDEPRSYNDDAATHYERVLDYSEITDQDSYLIVYESKLKHPVTQKNILYAIDSYGGYGDNYLPKGTQNTGNTEANTGLSMGIIGYPIYEYSEDGIKLYVDEEVDTKKSIHWNILGGPNAAEGSPFRIKNHDEYYYNNPYLYFGSKLMVMCDSSKTNLDKLVMEQYGGEYSGDFRFYYAGADSANYYLWCNDGSNQTLTDTYTNYYSNHGKTAYTPVFDGLEEVAGTFHMDAEVKSSSSGNLTGATVGIDPQMIHVYKRVVDPYSSTYTSRIYTDLDAELQADGTYTVTMETYATSPVQYQTMNYDRPTDFIFILDGSKSMTNNSDATGYGFWDKDLGIGTGLSLEDMSGKGKSDLLEKKETYTGLHNGFYYRLDDGTYCPLYVDASTNNSYNATSTLKVYYVYNGTKYYYQPNTGFTTSEVSMTGKGSSINSRYEDFGDSGCDDGTFNIPHYKWSTGITRLDAMKSAVTDLIYKIEDEAQRTGLNHRIAITEFGSNGSESWHNTGVYTNANTTMIRYDNANTANYQNAFHNTNNNTQVMNAINIIKAMKTDTADGDTYSQYGFEMAKKVMENSGSQYLVGGDRSCAVIFITDGIPALGEKDSDANRDACANSAISNANAIKSVMGGYVYSVQMGNNTAYGNMDKYLDYTSSNYIEAASLSDSGERNHIDIAYRVDIPTNNFDLELVTVNMFNSITSNSRNALSRCDTESVLREQLTTAFKMPSNVAVNNNLTVQFANANYDGLGRLQFGAPYDASGTVTATATASTNTITASGYDYGTYYVSEGNQANAKKLIITVTGVLADENAALLNTSINNTRTTAIYQDSLSDSQPVKYFPTSYFTIPEYTYALDYDMSLRDTDINGSPLAVSATLTKQDVNNYPTSLDTEMIGLDIENNDNLIYSIKKGADGTEQLSKGYILIQRPEGTYDWFRINIVPASNVLYNDDVISVSDTSGKSTWSKVGTADKSTLLSIANKDIYGYDENVAAKGITEFSNGSHIEATVSKDNNMSNKATFDYTGSGFDLIGSCGPDTGIQVITIKQRNADGSTTAKYAYLVDTFYNDATYGVLNQVPIVKHEGIHGDYTVEVVAAYFKNAGALSTAAVEEEAIEGTDLVAHSAPVDVTSADSIFAALGMDELIGVETEIIWFDENSILNGGNGADCMLSTQAGVTELKNYIDGYRIYNTLDTKTAEGKEFIQKYYDEKEQNAQYIDVMDNISSDGFFAYVEGGADPTATTGWTIADYKADNSMFPKNEAYLAATANNGIAFKFEANPSYRVMLAMRAASGTPVTVKVSSSANGTAVAKSFTIGTSTSMFYDITDYIGTPDANGYCTVTVKNEGGGLLAVDTLKLTNASLVAASLDDMPTVAMLMTASADPVIANSPEALYASTKYPYYVPDDSPVSDEIVDPEGKLPVFMPDLGAVENDTDIELSALEQFFAKIVDAFRNVIAFLKDTFNTVISALKNV